MEITHKETLNSDSPITHFQRGLEYEANQVHLWILSHEEATTGYLTYFLAEGNMIVHFKPKFVDSNPQVNDFISTEKAGAEAIYVAKRQRNRGGMKLLLGELFSHAKESHIKEIRLIDITENWLLDKLKDVLVESGYGEVFTIYPQEEEGGPSIIARIKK